MKIAGIVTSSGTVYKIQTRQGIACLFLEREEAQEADIASADSPKKDKLNYIAIMKDIKLFKKLEDGMQQKVKQFQ